MKAASTPGKDEVLRLLANPESNGHPHLQILFTDCKFDGEATVDAVAVDSAGRLVLLFHGPREENAWLLAILDSLAWIERNYSLLEERLEEAQWSRDLHPRLVLIASEFSKKFLARLKSMEGLDLAVYESGWVDLSGDRRMSLRPLKLFEDRGGDASQPLPGWALDPAAAAMLRTAVEKISKLDPQILADWGPRHVDFFYHGKLLALLAPGPGGLRLVIPGQTKTDLVLLEPSQLTRHLDLILRRYVETGLEEVETNSREVEIPNPAGKAGAGKAAAMRPALTAEELEAISK